MYVQLLWFLQLSSEIKHIYILQDGGKCAFTNIYLLPKQAAQPIQLWLTDVIHLHILINILCNVVWSICDMYVNHIQILELLCMYKKSNNFHKMKTLSIPDTIINNLSSSLPYQGLCSHCPIRCHLSVQSLLKAQQAWWRVGSVHNHLLQRSATQRVGFWCSQPMVGSCGG